MEKSSAQGKNGGKSELGLQFKRPSNGILFEDCLQQIGKDASHIENLIHQRLEKISSSDLNSLTNGLLDKDENGAILISRNKAQEVYSGFKVNSFSYHSDTTVTVSYSTERLRKYCGENFTTLFIIDAR